VEFFGHCLLGPFVLGAGFMAPRKPHIVGMLFFALAAYMAWQHGSEAWELSQTRRWLADVAGLGVALGGIIWLYRFDLDLNGTPRQRPALANKPRHSSPDRSESNRLF